MTNYKTKLVYNYLFFNDIWGFTLIIRIIFYKIFYYANYWSETLILIKKLYEQHL